ncbi:MULTISPECIES: TDP-N-acetylfucosamine:lipid II N-acetylfucosaminyltransferase [unclassified Achromobacter]|uniref:TDP-N-acetylfucosamine:lipid II N-acetylfucosaminyltransferase n=1 Tax=unclassified Achromobacter TaxID=2626865 RepID=UPI000B51DF6C|nr:MULTISPECIES: TDP-N-acetylfucosamine:lipid II N-acetylfucosaminyltransferase [unclassified Achromobacter]OWT79935.1 hypothetical protein CEY05_00445 [Achromobacter sp. HZ34]OWT81819.1 hypothetical protein CEY04_00445 [Achromobacter sp. HZ28]
MPNPSTARLLNRLPTARATRKPGQAQQQRMTARPPVVAADWLARARVLLDEGKIDEGRQDVEMAQSLGDDSATLWFLLARIEAHHDNTPIAISHFKKAIERDENLADAHHGLAGSLYRTDQWKEALKHIERALEVEPDRHFAKSLKALILLGLHRHSEAIPLFQELLKIDKSQGASGHLNNLGNAQRDVGQLQEAEITYRKATSLKPDDVNSWSNLLTLMHYMPERTAAEIEQVCREIGKLFAKNAKSKRPLPRNMETNKRLRVGMFSDGFRQHPVGAMTTTALEQLVKQGVDLYAYSTSSVSDYITTRIKAFCTKWQVVTSLTDNQFVEQIQDDEIDILVDLAGYGAGTHMRALTQEPAPLVVKWVGGLINTTGLESIDYLLTDAIESPDGTDHTYTEKLIRMPDDYICYLPPSRVPNVGPLPALKRGYVTFGCFNNPTKVNPVVLKEWAALLHLVPESRLHLKSGAYDSPTMRKMVLDTMTEQGIAEERVLFSGHSNHYALFQAYNDIDVALDPWPYSGGLTTCEAMLMGVPVVTLPGPTFAGRHSATHLVNAGLPDLVATTWDEYRERAAHLTSDLDSLAATRGHLRETLLKSPVCDGKRYAGHLANAFRAIWQRYCDGKMPAPLRMGKDGSARFDDEDIFVKLQQPALPPEEVGFQWSLPGKLIAVDSGGRLLDRPSTEGMLSLHMLETVVFDATSSQREHALVRREDVHYQPGLALGDGEQATLHDCLDSKLSGLLKPLDADSSNPTAGGRVLFQRAIPTIALDNINGLPAVDWLLLDSGGASATILNHGAATLAHTLLIDARVVFHPTHAGQPSLAEVDGWANRHGFRLHRLHGQENGHTSNLPGSKTLPPSFLLQADALYIPNAARLSQLDAGRRQKLACILHMGYGLEDVAYEMLAADGSDLTPAQEYLEDRYLAKAVQHDVIIGVHNVRNQNEANETVNLAHGMDRWNPLAIDVLIKRCVSILQRESDNDTAHFLLCHALLAKGELKFADGAECELPVQRDLVARLQGGANARKGTLFSHWLSDAKELANRLEAKISAVLVADRYTDQVVANVHALREQGGENIEIVLLNNGSPAADFSPVLPLLDFYVETSGNAGKYVSRNLAATYTRAPILLFVESDAMPEPGFLQAHIEAHTAQNIVAARGAYRLSDYKIPAPAHYNLGDEIIESMPTLEGNVSFSREAFTAVNGWGDYLLSEHGGIDIGHRMINKGYEQERQIYVPAAVLTLNDAIGHRLVEDKFAEQRASWRLLQAWGSTKQTQPARSPKARPFPMVIGVNQKCHVHLCYNNMHTQNFISMMSDPSMHEDFAHQILIEKRRSIPGYDNDISKTPNSSFFDGVADMERLIASAMQPHVEAIFIHGLFFPWQKEFVLKLAGRKKVIWILWGGDLYNPIRAGKPMHDVVAHIAAVATSADGDYRLFCETYGDRPRLQFAYPSNLDFRNIAVPPSKSKTIIVGNSGDSGNMHVEILDYLAGKSDIAEYEIVVPLGYNCAESYAQQLAAHAARRGLNKLELLTSFLPAEEYFKRLAAADMLITAHQRQQAMGNLTASLYFGNKTILRKTIDFNETSMINPLWEYLVDKMGVPPMSYDEFVACERLSDLSAPSGQALESLRTRIVDHLGAPASKSLLMEQFKAATALGCRPPNKTT